MVYFNVPSSILECCSIFREWILLLSIIYRYLFYSLDSICSLSDFILLFINDLHSYNNISLTTITQSKFSDQTKTKARVEEDSTHFNCCQFITSYGVPAIFSILIFIITSREHHLTVRISFLFPDVFMTGLSIALVPSIP